MKALKVVLVLAMVSFTMMAVAQKHDRVRPVFDAKMIPLANIEMQSDLGYAILAQVDGRFLTNVSERNGVYVAEVKFNGKILKIFGTYMQWYRFLKIHPNPLPYEKKVLTEPEIG